MTWKPSAVLVAASADASSPRVYCGPYAATQQVPLDGAVIGQLVRAHHPGRALLLHEQLIQQASGVGCYEPATNGIWTNSMQQRPPSLSPGSRPGSVLCSTSPTQRAVVTSQAVLRTRLSVARVVAADSGAALHFTTTIRERFETGAMPSEVANRYRIRSVLKESSISGRRSLSRS